MWYTYILYSRKKDRYYIGYTENITQRLQRHNEGWGRYTKSGKPWELVYFEEYDNKSDAIKREREIKNRKSRKYINMLIVHAGGRCQQ